MNRLPIGHKLRRGATYLLLDTGGSRISKRAASIDNCIDRETPECRIIRSQLRLSDHWEVRSKEVETYLPEYDDDHPDAPDGASDDPESWKTETLGKVTINIRMKRNRFYRCPHCGCMCRAHEYVDREYDHIPDMGYDMKLRVNLPKLHCTNCGKYPQVRFPLARPKVSYTKEFEKSVLRLLCKNTTSATAEMMHTGPWIVSDILDYRIRHALPEQDLSHVTTIYLDETQRRKGHEYMTVFSDNNHDVIYITEGKGMDAIERFCDYLRIQGGDPDNIWVVSADMSGTYESGVGKYFRNATLVWDRFHLVQAVNNALNDIRKRVLKRRKGERLRNVKYTVLKRPGNMTEYDAEKLSNIRLNNPELALAYDMKEEFCEVLECADMYEAQEAFEEWYAWVMIQGCQEMRERAERFKLKIDRILAWFDHRVNNGVAEGINSKIQKTKDAAYGYPNLDHFASMCMFRFGNLVIAF